MSESGTRRESATRTHLHDESNPDARRSWVGAFLVSTKGAARCEARGHGVRRLVNV